MSQTGNEGFKQVTIRNKIIGNNKKFQKKGRARNRTGIYRIRICRDLFNLLEDIRLNSLNGVTYNHYTTQPMVGYC